MNKNTQQQQKYTTQYIYIERERERERHHTIVRRSSQIPEDHAELHQGIVLIGQLVSCVSINNHKFIRQHADAGLIRFTALVI